MEKKAKLLYWGFKSLEPTVMLEHVRTFLGEKAFNFVKLELERAESLGDFLGYDIKREAYLWAYVKTPYYEV